MTEQADRIEALKGVDTTLLAAKTKIRSAAAAIDEAISTLRAAAQVAAHPPATPRNGSQPVVATFNDAATVTRPPEVFPHVAHVCATVDGPHVTVLFLDDQHRPRVSHRFQAPAGVVDALTPRAVARDALTLDAAAVIVFQKLENGLAVPGEEDIATVRTLKKALDLLDIQLLDHIYVGTGPTESRAFAGQL